MFLMNRWSTMKLLAALAMWCAVCTAHAQSLTLELPGQPARLLDSAMLRALPVIDIAFTQKREVDGRQQENTVNYKAVRLADVLARYAFDGIDRRAVRAAMVIAKASDNYMAAFSWGEIMNHASGQNIVIALEQQGGAPLGGNEGALTLRALDDVRPGPRHVRMLTHLRVVLP
jgi:hypothetical protein